MWGVPQRKPEAGGRRRRGGLLLLALLAAGLPGCSPAYVLRAGYEEARILWRRQPIENVLAGGSVDADERAKLELVLAARDFAARQLGLRAGGSYASLSRNDDAAVVYVVSAAERFRLRPYTWWFPIVGRVPYKGFFDPDRARREAGRLDAAGYDTWVRPAGGFSTLGWFDDPLLTSQLRLGREDLVNLVLHELLHTTSYTPGQAAFAESFASFAGYHGALAFFAARGEADAAARVADEWHDAVAFSRFLGGALERLEAAYAAGVTGEERAQLFAALQRDWAATAQRTDRYRGFAERTLNNAILLQLRVYHERLDLFDAILAAHDGDLAATLRAVIAATEGAADAFAAAAGLAAGSGLEAAETRDAETAGDDERGRAQSGGEQE